MKRNTDTNPSASESIKSLRALPWMLAIATCSTAIDGQVWAADEPYTHAICKHPYDLVADWEADRAAAMSDMTEEDREAGKPLCPRGPGPSAGYPRPADPPVVPVATLRASILRPINSIQSVEDTTPDHVDEVIDVPWAREESNEWFTYFGMLDDGNYGSVRVNRLPQPRNFSIMAHIGYLDPSTQCSVEADVFVDALIGEGWKVDPDWSMLDHGQFGRIFSKDLPEQHLQVNGELTRSRVPIASRYCLWSVAIRIRHLDASP